MAIEITCSCGRPLRAKDEHAGRKSRCPGCGGVLTIPDPAGSEEVLMVPCACGKVLKAPARFAGKRAKCKGCGGVLTIPDLPPPAPAGLDDEDEGGQYALADEPSPRPPTLAFPPPPTVAEEDDAEEDDRDDAEESPRRGGGRRLVAASGMREYLYLLLILAFIPLGLILLGSESEDLKARIERSLDRYPQIVQDLEEEMSVTEVIDALAEVSPDGKLDGKAHLPRQSRQHWAYGGLAAAGFFGLLLALFPRRETTGATKLLLCGVFTGTIGIILLLGVQLAAGFTQGIWIRGRGMIAALFYLVKFIGFSYHAALNPENGFWFSLFGFTFGVGLCEELCKALPLIKHNNARVKWDWRGYCLLGLASGAGFGISEGIIYAGEQYNGISGLDVYIVRFVSCVALHAVWSASAGVALARSVDFYEGAEGADVLLPWVRVLGVPMLLHGLYDTLLKRELNAYALVAALVSFAWLTYQIEAARADDAAELAEA